MEVPGGTSSETLCGRKLILGLGMGLAPWGEIVMSEEL
jgi:hypothetical protein